MTLSYVLIHYELVQVLFKIPKTEGEGFGDGKLGKVELARRRRDIAERIFACRDYILQKIRSLVAALFKVGDQP